MRLAEEACISLYIGRRCSGMWRMLATPLVAPSLYAPPKSSRVYSLLSARLFSFTSMQMTNDVSGSTSGHALVYGSSTAQDLELERNLC